MRTCILHIGHPKTGTSYLQTVLHLNEHALRAAGYAVPSDFVRFGFHDYRDLAERGATFSGNLGPVFWAHERGEATLGDEILRSLFDAPEQHLMLSSELFFYYRELTARVAMAAIHAGFEVRVIAYLQRQDRAAIAGYLQNVRNHGFSGTPLDFFRATAGSGYFRYVDQLDHLRSLHPRLHVLVRSFDRRFLEGGDLAADFLATAGCPVDPAQLRRPTRRIGTGLVLETYELLRALHRMGRADLVQRLIAHDTEADPDERSRCFAYYYRPAVRTFVLEHFIPGNRRLLDLFLPDASPALRAYWAEAEPAGEATAFDPNRVAERLSLLLRG